MKTRLATANLFAGNLTPLRTIQALLAQVRLAWARGKVLGPRPHYVLFQEGMSTRTKVAIADIPSYNGLHAPGRGEAAAELPMLRLRRLRGKSTSYRPAAKAIPGNPRNHSDRGIHVATSKRGLRGRVLESVLDTHLHVQTPESHQEYKGHVAEVLVTIQDLQHADHAVCGAADANSVDGDRDGLQHALRQIGMKVVSDGVMCVFWDPRRYTAIGRVAVIPAAAMHLKPGEHNGLAVRLEHRRKR